MERLTAQEESVMLYIWKLGSCFIRDILNEMPDPKPPYTSVASVVRNLEKKKYVTPKKFGTITLFSPRVKEAEYKRTFMSNVVQKLFHRFFIKKWFSSLSAIVNYPKAICRT